MINQLLLVEYCRIIGIIDPFVKIANRFDKYIGYVGKKSLIVHNIGAGPVIEDCFLSWKIVGHYQYEKK